MSRILKRLKKSVFILAAYLAQTAAVRAETPWATACSTCYIDIAETWNNKRDCPNIGAVKFLRGCYTTCGVVLNYPETPEEKKIYWSKFVALEDQMDYCDKNFTLKFK